MLREAEQGCRELINANRSALDLMARALLEHETVSGAEVSRLIRVANGTEPDVGPPSSIHSGNPKAPATPAHGHLPGSQNPGALPAPPPLPPHLNPGGGVAARRYPTLSAPSPELRAMAPHAGHRRV